MTPEQIIQKLLDASRQAPGSAMWHEENHAAAVSALRQLEQLRRDAWANTTPPPPGETT